jgi:hypothetical protein
MLCLCLCACVCVSACIGICRLHEHFFSDKFVQALTITLTLGVDVPEVPPGFTLNSDVLSIAREHARQLTR